MKIWQNKIKLQMRLIFHVREYLQLFFWFLNEKLFQISNNNIEFLTFYLKGSTDASKLKKF